MADRVLGEGVTRALGSMDTLRAPGQESCPDQQCCSCPCGGHHPICREPLCPVLRAGHSAVITGHLTADSVFCFDITCTMDPLMPPPISKHNSHRRCWGDACQEMMWTEGRACIGTKGVSAPRRCPHQTPPLAPSPYISRLRRCPLKHFDIEAPADWHGLSGILELLRS